MNNEQNIVPAFDCRERNQCSGSDYVNLCNAQITKPDFSVRNMDNNKFIFKNLTKSKNLVSWVWDVINTIAQEPFYTGETIEANVTNPTGTVRLTVIGKNGCFAFNDKGFHP